MSEAVRAVGLDVGAVRAKVSASGVGAWHRPVVAATSGGRLVFGEAALAGTEPGTGHACLVNDAVHAARDGRDAEILRDYLAWLLDAGGVALTAAEVVVAVPDRWTVADDGTWSAFSAGDEGEVVRRVVTRLRGAAGVRLVPGTQCTLAGVDTGDGCVLVCDVGSRRVSAAVYAREGRTTRLLDMEHADTADSGLPEALSRAVRTPAATGDVLHWAALEHERYLRSSRAARVLELAAERQRYRSTPVYLSGRHGGTVDAATLLAALEGLADLVGAVVGRLVGRCQETLLDEAVVTGGNAVGPVAGAVASASGGRVDRVRVVPPCTAADGARLIAEGEQTVVERFPHQLGLAIRFVRAGLLGGDVLTVAEAGSQAVEVTVPADHTGPLPVRVRVNGEGGWQPAPPATEIDVRPGRYLVNALGRHSGLGALLLRSDTGEDIVYPLGKRVPDQARSAP